VPAGSVPVVIVTVDGELAGLTMITKLAEACVLCESCAMAVKANVPAVVGVPLMRPDEAPSARPAGNAPDVTLQV
jgi:hypothetical protein